MRRPFRSPFTFISVVADRDNNATTRAPYLDPLDVMRLTLDPPTLKCDQPHNDGQATGVGNTAN